MNRTTRSNFLQRILHLRIIKNSAIICSVLYLTGDFRGDIRFILRAFVFPQRRMWCSKHIELEYDINFWQDNKIVFVGK